MQTQPASTAVTPIDYRLVIACSLLLSLWLIAIDPVLGRDAILYLRSADAYLEGGLVASQQLFGRPLLSICFAVVHQLTGLPLLWAGLLLNALFYALFCAAFVSVVYTLGGDRRVQLIAAVVVLSHPVLNEQRSSIMRDPAYWAFCMLACRELLLYVRRPGLKHRLRWVCYILLASLFRFEGLFLAALAPLSLLAIRRLSRRVLHCLQLLLPLLAVTAVLVGALLISGHGANAVDYRFPGIETYIDRLLHFPHKLGQLSASAGDALLKGSAREDAGAAVLGGLAAIAALNICRALTWPWVLTMLWGWRRKTVAGIRRDDHVLLQAHLLISLLYLAIFTLINRFMLERYAAGFVIFALLYLPFILDSMWRGGRHSGRRILAALLLLAMSLDSLHNTDYQKAFIRDARDWLQEHTPGDASLVSNNQYLAYFGGREFDWEMAGAGNWDLSRMLSDPQQWQYRDYLAMRVTRHDRSAWAQFLEENGMTETAVFDGGKHGKVAIIDLNRWRRSASRDDQ